MKPFK